MQSPEIRHSSQETPEQTTVTRGDTRVIETVPADIRSEKERSLRTQLEIAEDKIEKYRAKLKTMDQTNPDYAAYEQILKNLSDVKDRFQHEFKEFLIADAPKETTAPPRDLEDAGDLSAQEQQTTTVFDTVRDVVRQHSHTKIDSRKQVKDLTEQLSNINVDDLKTFVEQNPQQGEELLFTLRVLTTNLSNAEHRIVANQLAELGFPAKNDSAILSKQEQEALRPLLDFLQTSLINKSGYLQPAAPRPTVPARPDNVEQVNDTSFAQGESENAEPNQDNISDIQPTTENLFDYSQEPLHGKIAFLQQLKQENPDVFERFLLETVQTGVREEEFATQYDALSSEEQMYLRDQILPRYTERVKQTGGGDNMTKRMEVMLKYIDPAFILSPDRKKMLALEAQYDKVLSERAKKFRADKANAPDIYPTAEALEEAAKRQEEKRVGIQETVDQQKEQEWIYTQHKEAIARRNQRQEQEKKHAAQDAVRQLYQEREQTHTISTQEQTRLQQRYNQLQDTITQAILAIDQYPSGYTIDGAGNLEKSSGLKNAIARQLMRFNGSFQEQKNILEAAQRDIAAVEKKIQTSGGDFTLDVAKSAYVNELRKQVAEQANELVSKKTDEELSNEFAHFDKTYDGAVRVIANGETVFIHPDGTILSKEEFFHTVERDSANLSQENAALRLEIANRWWDMRAQAKNWNTPPAAIYERSTNDPAKGLQGTQPLDPERGVIEHAGIRLQNELNETGLAHLSDEQFLAIDENKLATKKRAHWVNEFARRKEQLTRRDEGEEGIGEPPPLPPEQSFQVPESFTDKSLTEKVNALQAMSQRGEHPIIIAKHMLRMSAEEMRSLRSALSETGKQLFSDALSYVTDNEHEHEFYSHQVDAARSLLDTLTGKIARADTDIVRRRSHKNEVKSVPLQEIDFDDLTPEDSADEIRLTGT